MTAENKIEIQPDTAHVAGGQRTSRVVGGKRRPGRGKNPRAHEEQEKVSGKLGMEWIGRQDELN